MRASWPKYYMQLAHHVATRGTCDRKQVGAVIVRSKKILATGYNGSLPGLAHCDDAGHQLQDNHCVRTLHAEWNAVAQAASEGTSIKGAVAYVTAFPCYICFKLLVAAGIYRVYYSEAYRIDEKVVEASTLSGVEIVDIEDAISAARVEAGT